VQPQDQRVQLGVIARPRGDLIYLRQPGIGQCPAGGRQAARLGDLLCRVADLDDQPVVHGAPVQAAQRRHQVLFCVAPAAGVAAGLLAVGAKWGAMNGRHRAIQDLLHRSIPLICQALSNDQLHQPTAEISFASKWSCRR